MLLTVHAHLTLVLEIALVSDEHHREVVLVFDSKDLLVELVDLLERLSSGDRVNEDEPFSGAHVLFTHRSIENIVREQWTGGLGESEGEWEIAMNGKEPNRFRVIPHFEPKL